EKKKYQLSVGNKIIELEFSNLAELANGSVMAKMGETVILTNVVMGNRDRNDLDFFPLLVDYEEKYYAAGKIYGSRFIRRESRPSEIAILLARLIDRTIRPLFSPLMRRDVQVVATCLSIDEEHDPDVLGIIATSLALGTSDIPWQGPVSAVRIGWSEETDFLVNPTYEERKDLILDMIVSGSGKEINMLEAGANEVKEDIVIQALEIAQKEITSLNEQQQKIIREIGKPKTEVLIKTVEETFLKDVQNYLTDKLEPIVYSQDKKEKEIQMTELKEGLVNFLKERQYTEEQLKDVDYLFDDEINKLVHKNILEQDKRPDFRKLDEIRPLEVVIDILPRTHGSALFMRGITHALSVVTLGSPADVLTLQGMEFTGEKRFMHHYNFPGYSSGEVAPLRGPGRREIGHGALGERALLPMIPTKDEFPYTIRVVSEIMSSNGSTSMAATCASSLALMAAGVPIKEQVAGIAMGLMSDDKGHYKILTDIQGPEDHYGDMDCKVAGTKNGITALQMDLKIKGIAPQLLTETLEKAKIARLFVLDKMNQVINQTRKELSSFAPRIFTLHIKPEKIGELIGPGGKVIQAITQATGVNIDIEEDGTVFVTAEDQEKADLAIQQITEIVKDIAEGDIINGKVTQIKDFGAFVDLGHRKEGLLHISELAPYRVNKVEDIVHQGEEIKVKVKKVEANGKISLSLKEVKYPSKEEIK
ncbi:MAG: polyribonucleotide nucleotidyltransferase, partial [Candidatus Falkowbacteria bacterium]|nr:polyribonucleotide nucleotidyltransferase [Candidatus Falkowbacteria bacterium]